MNCIDFHCHLDMKNFTGKRREIAAECFASGFAKLVTVADPYETESLAITGDILGYHQDIFCTVGAHPHNADGYDSTVEKNLLDFYHHQQQRVIAVGEVGLDYHYNLSDPANQVRVFKRQLAIAAELRLPVVIHSREAEKVSLDILEETGFQLPVVYHCYTGSIEDAREILKREYYISISGIVTFKNSGFLREITRIVPLNRIFTETDAPYLSPEPFRGKGNTPLRVRLVAEKVAEVKGISLDILNEAIQQNFKRISGVHS